CCASREHDFAYIGGIEEASYSIACEIVRIGRVHAERVDATMDVGILFFVIAHESIDDGLRFLRRRRVVEVHERLAMNPTLKDWEIFADPRHVESSLRDWDDRTHGLTSYAARSLARSCRCRRCSTPARTDSSGKRVSTSAAKA